MKRVSTRQLGVLLVVIAIALGGCLGGGGGGGDGDATTTTVEPTDADDGMSDGDGDGDGASDGDGDGDGDGDTTTTTATTTATTTQESTGDGPIDVQQHTAALQQAGSFTVEFTIESQTGTLEGTEQVDLDTGEHYSLLGGLGSDIEYYSPPDDSTAYQFSRDEVREIPQSQAFFLNISEFGTGDSASALPAGLVEDGTGETSLGPATRYAATSVDKVPEDTAEQYDEITDFNMVVLVDADTGIIAEYSFSVTGVIDGEEQSQTITFSLSNVGSTTIERPDWMDDA